MSKIWYKVGKGDGLFQIFMLSGSACFIDSPAQGPGHAALVLRMVLLRRSLQRVHLRGVEAILELRRQRQVRYAILESGVLL